MNSLNNIIDKIQNQYSPDSPIWIYMADRKLSQSEWIEFSESADKFIQSWKSHGKAVSASWFGFQNRIIFLVADISEHPSGCSIDSSVAWLKLEGQKFSIDFFNRLKIPAIEAKTNDLVIYSLSQWKEKAKKGDFQNQFLESLNVLNNAISKVSDLNQYQIPYSKSLIHV